MPSHFYNCRTFISIPATTASEKSSGAREHQNQARERGLAGGELVAVVQLPINLSHTWQSSALPLPGRITFKDQVQKLSKENYSLIKETETHFPCSRLLVKKDQHKQRWWIDTWQINISHSLAHISKIFTKCTPPQTSLPGKYMKSAPPSTIYLNVNMWNLLHPSPIYLNSPSPPFPAPTVSLWPLRLPHDRWLTVRAWHYCYDDAPHCEAHKLLLQALPWDCCQPNTVRTSV